MLVLSRRQGQSIIVSDTIEISVTEIKGDQVRLGISAPRNVKIFRKEIYEQIQDAMRSAAQSTQSIQGVPGSSKLSDLQKLLQERAGKRNQED
ncbi:carbon storage regulator CsrA [Candidatus Haliotispira prima]|uniref:Translational regulator CsrA n=1 Tax=Candidatus Haliotispira prima TaxID=3034016 RepID=A0ABY8MFK5_9SPIO|nr:carbon storage regulator CsrA [Candidatus Haliotispira prima]